ncbi:helix-turn-helix domain-containing protein [Rhodococcus sp. 14-2483-1-2]|uniref:PucR family transcriptional regulator n=1 Tax=Rhodococcus sp. 14-2483-1-2 TaxID=2023147 RepID=UPI0011404BFC|nr:helix-turn-helix domain-containing protein [Rhodococcus sp. 14-2483-1-2]
MYADGARLQWLVERLDRVDDQLEPTVAEVRREVPVYDSVPRDSLAESVERNLHLAARVLREGRVPPARDVWEAEVSTRERLRQGVRIDEIMGAFRVQMARIQRRVVELAPECDITPAEALALSSLLWELGDAFSTKAATVYRDHDITVAVAEQQARTEWVLGVLRGTLSTADTHRGVQRYRVPADAPLYAVCASPLHDGRFDQVFRGLNSVGTGFALVVPSEGRCVGIVSQLPPDSAGVVAIGSLSVLEEMTSSFDLATRVFAAAQRLGLPGVFSLEKLTWRVAIPQQPELSAFLREKYLGPLESERGFGALVVEALRAYLLQGRSIPKAAASIPVHVNTLRYRLARFEMLTGCSLDDSDAVVELSWMLFDYDSR